MNESMNKPSVSELYRRFAGSMAGADVTGADQIEAQMASSPAAAQLRAFSRELEPVSAALSANLAVALHQASEAAGHRRHAVSRRSAVGARRLRGIAALAAAVVAAVVVWGGGHRMNAPIVPIANTQAPDRIFAAFGEETIANTGHSGASDEIFRGGFHGESGSDESINTHAKGNNG